MAATEEVIQYVPFMSFVDPSFWHSLMEMKLQVDKLNDTAKQIFGEYTYREDLRCMFEVDNFSFHKTRPSRYAHGFVTGTIINKNTIEEFKELDKSVLLNTIGESIYTIIKDKSWIQNPSLLLRFFILSFADLKKYSFYYWFAFPAPNQPILYLKQRSLITNILNENQLKDLSAKYANLDVTQKSFFTITTQGDNVVIRPVFDILDPAESFKEHVNIAEVLFGFVDPSNGPNPGWPLRIYLAALLEHCPSLKGCNVRVIGLRYHDKSDIDKSQYYEILVPLDAKPVESAGWVGWERNDKGNFGPQLANMSSSMDPVKLADQSSDLNITLMKWRLVPELDVDIMKKTKCLLLGTGTLGCHVARDLLAWGFKNITFLDSGLVSYSNPTRQVLFNHEDCHKHKAEAAADNLRLILPSVKTKSIVVHIPMPGHTVGPSLVEETISHVNILTQAIEEHDVIFLLLDSREARWLPTLIAAHFGKIVINAALGFDSYLVMRHGIASSTPISNDCIEQRYIPGSSLGCYFCNDVTAPGNSQKDRTLDQQCTVTRPGVAAMAGALAVELLVALLQHNLKVEAPAAYNLSEEIQKGFDKQAQSVLGPIPHSIRGFLWSYQTVLPTCIRFAQCIACSNIVLQKYRAEGMQFLMTVFNNAKYLEEVTGLVELQLSAEMSEVLTLDDSDEDFE